MRSDEFSGAGLTGVGLKHFTAFSDLDLRLSPGVNAFVGRNGTGKTHLMKVCYAACCASKPGVSFMEKLVRVFLPRDRAPGRLVTRQQGSARAVVEACRGASKLRAVFSNHVKRADSGNVSTTGAKSWSERPIESVQT